MSYIEDRFKELGVDPESLYTADDSTILRTAELCGITFPDDRDRDEFLFLTKAYVIEPETLFAAFKGSAEASDEVSEAIQYFVYEDGSEVEDSEAHAMYMFRKAVSQGLTNGHSRLARYLIGNGWRETEKRCEEEAFVNARTACENDERDGAFLYARCLLEGIGTEPDEKKGMDIMMMLAGRNNGKASEYIADCYLSGRSFERDREKGLEWLYKSYKMGNEDAGSRYMLLMEKSGDFERGSSEEELNKVKENIGKVIGGEYDGKVPAPSRHRPNFHIGVEIAGIALAAALYGITVFFFKIGAGGSNYQPQIKLGFFMKTLANLGCLAGIFLTAVSSCAMFTFSMFDDFISGGIIGGIAALLEMFTLYAYPVVVTYVMYACIGLAALFVIRIIMKLLGGN